MTGLQEFLDMGGYAAFVWPCFGVTIALLIGLFVTSKKRLAQLETEVAALEALDGSRQSRRRAAPEESR